MDFVLQCHHLLSRMPAITLFGPLILLLVAVAAIYYLRLARQLREQFATQQRISMELNKLSTAVEQSPASIVITDRNGVIEYVNPAFCRMTGYTVEEARGQYPSILKGGDQPQEYYREMWETILSGQEWRGEFHNRRKDGSLFWELASVSPIRNEKGEVTHFVAVKENITERKQLLEHLDRMAHYDALTGLPNRALFFERLSLVQALACRENRRFALLYLDLDGFKEINDTHGHLAGDAVLQWTAERLKGCVRESDTVARMGGDEFIVILCNVTRTEDAGMVAEKIIKSLDDPVALEATGACRVGASIGISIYPDDGQNLEKLVSAADTAMYAAKRAGKNRYSFCG